MEIAARRIDTKRPARAARPLPRGQTHRAAEERRDAAIRDRLDGGAASEQRMIGSVAGDDVPGEGNDRRAAIPPERVRLLRPVEITRRPGEAVEVVLGGLVVAKGRYLDSSLIRRSSSAIAWPSCCFRA